MSTGGSHRRRPTRSRTVGLLAAVTLGAVVAAIAVVIAVLGSDGDGISPAPGPATAASPPSTAPSTTAPSTTAPSAVDAARSGPADAVTARLREIGAATPLRFAASGATLTPDGATAVDRAADVLRAAPSLRVTLTGHVAPAIPRNPARGEMISRQRAEAVARRLEAEGIAPERLTVVAAGPADPGPTRESARRVDITVA